ncbi:50S ribosomal protein L11 methyltransferase [Helicobacter sp. MIT 14-3879]|uniref:50S ribosomal protein L11 methyltransferase n=1 Tax=Helicobacter sp. MIT 14-3879 TaxID=2040649 RepID=UPI0015F17A4A|nr:50S ribosomal protein L11 methyltransferase [Helicobacter sp. MIT 14-3879]
MGFYFEVCITPNYFSDIFASEIIDFTKEAIEQINNNSSTTIIIRADISLSKINLLLNRLQDLSNKLSVINNIDVNFTHTIIKKQNKDWVDEYKNSITPIQCCRFYIRPPWGDILESTNISFKNNKTDNIIEIILEPSLAFGSGHHSSTSMCIEALESCKYSENTTLLDVGCGSGILALCANKLGASVYLCDIDELAVNEAKKNFLNNNAIISAIWHGSINTNANNKDKYDIVTANIIASVLIEHSLELIASLKDNGILILSGILDIYEDSVLECFRELKLIDRKYDKEWICLKLQKY